MKLRKSIGVRPLKRTSGKKLAKKVKKTKPKMQSRMPSATKTSTPMYRKKR